MRRVFAAAATLAGLACCEAFGSSSDAPTSGDGGLDATMPPAEGSIAVDDAAGPTDAGVVDGSSVPFCEEQNLNGRSTIACEDFEGTDASHGFADEGFQGLTAQRTRVAIGGRAPNGLVVSGAYSGAYAVGGVVDNSPPTPTGNLRLRFLVQIRSLIDSDGASPAHVQIAYLQFGGVIWAIKFVREANAATFYTTLGSKALETTAVRSLNTPYEIWLDIVHDHGSMTGKVSIDGVSLGSQTVDEPVSTGWLVRVGGFLDEGQDEVNLAIDDVVVQALPPP